MRELEGRIHEGSSCADTKVGEEGEGSGQHWSRDSPVACGAAHGEAAGCPEAHGGSWCSKYSPAGPGEPPAQTRRSPNEAVTLWETCIGAAFWQF